MNYVETPLDRREKRKLVTRTRIEDAAYELFKAHGIEATSIEMICQQADVARRTFYSHYPNKHTLLGGLGVSRLYNQAAPMMQTLMETHQATLDRLDAMIDFIEARFATYEEIDRQLIISGPAAFSSDPENQKQVSSSAVNSFLYLITAGQEQGDVRTELSAETLSLMMVGTLNALSIRWAIEPTYPVMERLEEVRTLFKSTLCIADT